MLCSPLIQFPCIQSNVLAGSRFKDAFQDAGSYLSIEPLFEVYSF